MKTKIKAIVEIAKELNDELIKEWMKEVNPAKANQLLADVNRMKYITAKCEEILKRAEKEKKVEKTPLEKQIERAENENKKK